ncbi:hypothetical protein NECAME_14486 [Necator americanus]|uniref:Uncharacterized protein n=1 Tax=Necator americanus TaxID=51031 RepID=W2SMX7_NECAM|nr:hypothetical protein NECAME_14486 [Necator americanus]ETN70863.1 hypothetical protein NECAME_14486 [Necator americanus]
MRKKQRWKNRKKEGKKKKAKFRGIITEDEKWCLYVNVKLRKESGSGHSTAPSSSITNDRGDLNGRSLGQRSGFRMSPKAPDR